MKKKKFFGEYDGYVKIGVAIILVIIGWPVLTNIVNSLKNSANVQGAVNNAPANAAANDPAAGSAAVRQNKIQGLAESLRSYLTGTFNWAGTVVELLNSTASGVEVAALSDYYMRSYGKSLLAEVNDELGSWVNMSGKGWNDLKDYVKQNLT